MATLTAQEVDEHFAADLGLSQQHRRRRSVNKRKQFAQREARFSQQLPEDIEMKKKPTPPETQQPEIAAAVQEVITQVSQEVPVTEQVEPVSEFQQDVQTQATPVQQEEPVIQLDPASAQDEPASEPVQEVKEEDLRMKGSMPLIAATFLKAAVVGYKKGAVQPSEDPSYFEIAKNSITKFGKEIKSYAELLALVPSAITGNGRVMEAYDISKKLEIDPTLSPAIQQSKFIGVIMRLEKVEGLDAKSVIEDDDISVTLRDPMDVGSVVFKSSKDGEVTDGRRSLSITMHFDNIEGDVGEFRKIPDNDNWVYNNKTLVIEKVTTEDFYIILSVIVKAALEQYKVAKKATAA